MTQVFPLPIAFTQGDLHQTIYPVLIASGDELILIDAGYPNQLADIESAIRKAGFDLGDVARVFITHHDHDHVGSLFDIKKNYPSIEIVCSEKEAPFVSGLRKPLRLVQAESIFDSLPEEHKPWAQEFERYLKSIQPVKVDRRVTPGESIDKLTNVAVIETPGHTEGHCSLVISSINTLVAADALVYENRQLALANPGYAFDLKLATESAKWIQEQHFETIYCYHGGLCKVSEATFVI